MRFTRTPRRAHIWLLKEPINTTERNDQRIGTATASQLVIPEDGCWSDKGCQRLLLSPQHNSRVGIAKIRRGSFECFSPTRLFLLLSRGKPLTHFSREEK